VLVVDGYIRLEPAAPNAVASVQRWQVANCAARRGWRIGRVFNEPVDPAAAAGMRSLLRAAIERVASGESDGIVVVTLAHLGDSLADALCCVERIVAAGGAFVSVRDGIDLSTPTGQQIYRLLIGACEWWPPR
jgi:DNA invertase Pin-like site-specific DNA recombinase